MQEKFLISLFPIYRLFYNLQGHIFHFFGYWGNKLHPIPWYDPKIWHKHKNHPSHKPWVKDTIRHIYFSTGMIPKPEYEHLLKQQNETNETT